MHKPLLYTVIGCVLGGAALTILQMWTQLLQWDAFIKILGTLGIVLLVAGFLLVVKSDFGDTKKLKDQNYLD